MLNDLDEDRKVVYLDTNSLHYLDLFVRHVQNSHLTVNDIESQELARQFEQSEDIGYGKGLQKGHRIFSFVLRKDAQVEFSHVSKIELLCGRVRGAVIVNAAKQGIPDRMWSHIGEKEIRDGSNEADLQRIRERIDDLEDALADFGIIVGVASEPKRILDILGLAAFIVGYVYMSATDSMVYASAIAARADWLITGDYYLRKTANRIQNPNGRARYEVIQRLLKDWSDGPLPRARDC